MTFVVGDAVMVSNDGNTFDTYHSWPDIAHVPHFQYGGCPLVGHPYTITHIGQHEFQSHGTAPLLLYVLNGEFIVGFNYLHKIEATNGLQQTNRKVGKISRPRTGGWSTDSHHPHVSQNPRGFV